MQSICTNLIVDARNNLQDTNPHLWTLGTSCNAQGIALLKYKKGSYSYDCGGVTFGLKVFVKIIK